MENTAFFPSVHLKNPNPVCTNNRTSGCSSAAKFAAATALAWLLIFLLGQLVGPGEGNEVREKRNEQLVSDRGYFKDNFIRFEKHVDSGEIVPLACEVESWNQKNTSSFPFEELYREYADNGITGSEGLSDGQLRIMSAFLYEEYIVVTHTAQNSKGVGRKAYCHYYDCNRREILGSVFESFVFPMTAVHCARRAGAKYMSLTFGEEEVPQEPIPLINRIFKNPPHEVGVCVGQIYGSEKKWLEIIEYVEHYKLMGASMFYFTILEMDEYSKRTIEDYERTGEIEATKVHLEYSKINWLFHMIQTHECFFRGKFHSKWMIHTDIDERLVMNSMPLISYLRHQPPETCEINFGSRRVQKLDDDPVEYKSDSQVASNMLFLRYNITSPHHWVGFKSVFKPDKVHMIFFHWTLRQQEGCVVRTANDQTGYVRHYRTVDLKSWHGNWVNVLRPYSMTGLDPGFSITLKDRVLKRVKFLYDQHPVYCSSIDPWIRSHFKNDIHCT